MKKNVLFLFHRPSALVPFWLQLATLLVLGCPATAQIRATGSTAAKFDPETSATENALIVCQGGGVQSWGANTQPTPAAVVGPGLFSIVAVSSAKNSFYALRSDGVLLAWGANFRGELGRGFVSSYEAIPAPVPGLPGIVAVGSGYGFAVALGSDGSVWNWGLNGVNSGTYGAGNGQSVPTHLTSGFGTSPIVAIQCGTFCAMALNQLGQVYSWGYDQIGEMGVGGLNASLNPLPQQLSFPAGSGSIRQIHASTTLSLALDSNSKAYGWGSLVGNGTSAAYNVPVAVPALDGATYLGSSALVSSNLPNSNATTGFAAYDNGPACTTKVWGGNSHGGFGICSPALTSFSPVPGPTFPTGTKIIGSGDTLLSVQTNGTAKTWGNRPLGYAPTSPGPQGGSCVPTAPVGVCATVANKQPVCTQVFSHRGPIGAGVAYQASLHRAINLPFDIGEFGQLTTIDANRTEYGGNTVVFNGVYHVWGNVRFVGNVRLEPGTVFYMDGDNGRVISSVDDSQLVSLEATSGTLALNGATLRASCNSLWAGIVVGTGGQLVTTAPSGVHSLIRDAQFSVQNVAGTLRLDQTDFLNNARNIIEWKQATSASERITNCSFRITQAAGGPLETSFYGLYNSYGIIFSESGSGTSPIGDFTNAVYSTNTFDRLRYGIYGLASNALISTNNFFDCWGSALEGYISSATAPGSLLPLRFHDNRIRVPYTFPLTSPFSASRPAYGVNAQNNVDIRGNSFELVATSTGRPSRRIGVSLLYGGTVRESATIANRVSTFDNFDVGIQANGADWVMNVSYDFSRNDFYGLSQGITFQPPGPYVSNPGAINITLRCNSFDTSTSPDPSAATGVLVKDKTAFAPTLGTPTLPNGNRFDGIVDVKKRFVYDVAQPVPFVYYRFNSAQEAFSGSGNSICNLAGATVVTANNSSTTPALNACGAGSPGVNARAATALLPAALLQSRQDSLARYSLAAARQTELLASVLDHHRQAQSFTALEAYLRPLIASRPAVYIPGALLLLNAYRRTGHEASAQRVRPTLNELAATDAELLNYLRYWDAEGRLRSDWHLPTGYVLPAADIAALRLAAASGTLAARPACELLQRLDTNCRCVLSGDLAPTVQALLAQRTGTATTTLLGEAYPNPTTGHATLDYALPIGSTGAKLVLRDLTGRQVLAQALEGPTGAVVLAVAALPSGLYVATLEVNGHRYASRKLAVAH